MIRALPGEAKITAATNKPSGPIRRIRKLSLRDKEYWRIKLKMVRIINLPPVGTCESRNPVAREMGKFAIGKQRRVYCWQAPVTVKAGGGAIRTLFWLILALLGGATSPS